ncbi:MAG: PP2C family protein-serine/threonine phosphatase [Acidimicrobiales bacterium]
MAFVSSREEAEPAESAESAHRVRPTDLHAATRYAQLLGSAIIGVAMGRDTTVIEANDTFLTMIDRRRDELERGEIDWVAITPDRYHVLEEEGREILRSGEPFPFLDKVYERPDGTEVPVRVGATMIRSNPFEWLAIVIERPDPPETEQILASHLHDANLEIGELARKNAHAREVVTHTRRAADALVHAVLPAALPDSDDWLFACAYHPAATGREIGGDWYDVMALDDGRFLAVVGDAAGKGPRASTLMGRLSNAARTRALLDPDPCLILDSMAHMLVAHDPTELATALVAILEPDGTLRWASAGHPPPLIRHHDGRVETERAATRPPLPWNPDGSTVTHTERLARGDLCVMVSDGILERRGESIDIGVDRVRTVLEADPGHDPTALCDRIAEECPDDPSWDDLTIMVLART